MITGKIIKTATAVTAVTAGYSCLRGSRRWAMERHLLYEITQCYLPLDTGGRASC